MKFEYNGSSFDIKRYPYTQNRSLRPWNAADELTLQYLSESKAKTKNIALVNDRFGFMATVLNTLNPISITNHKSHKKSIEKNYSLNSLNFTEDYLLTPLSELPLIDVAYIKIPKSLDEFEFYLAKISDSISDDGIILCGFMTKYFSSSIIEICNKYFDVVEQTRAQKKARLIILKEPKTIGDQLFIRDIKFKNKVYKQYSGVFSSNHIDYATQFLIEHLNIKEGELKILDLASGNGVIASQAKSQNPNAKFHLVDDSFLAIESSKLNIKDAQFHWNDTLEEFSNESFDLVATNPPFHFEYETNIEVSLNLFKQVHRVLKFNGRFLVVANKHLNYKTHLAKEFETCSVLKENERFIIYECVK